MHANRGDAVDSAASQAHLFIDGHVHLHEPEAETSLTSAASNLAAAAAACGRTAGYGLLLVADTPRAQGLERVLRLGSPDSGHAESQARRWTIRSRPDEHTVHVSYPTLLPLAVVAGRQFNSSEKLEVLIFPRRNEAEDGMRAADLLNVAIESEAVAILPWGAGKWLGKRGSLVRRLLTQFKHPGILIGDSGGRPTLWRQRAIFSEAHAGGVRELRGTDPLPLPGEQHRIGTFGSFASAEVDPTWTCDDLLSVLRQDTLYPFGRLMNPYTFIRNQIALRSPRHRDHPIERAT